MGIGAAEHEEPWGSGQVHRALGLTAAGAVGWLVQRSDVAWPGFGGSPCVVRGLIVELRDASTSTREKLTQCPGQGRWWLRVAAGSADTGYIFKVGP